MLRVWWLLTCVGQQPGLCVAWHVHLETGAAGVEAAPLKLVDTLVGWYGTRDTPSQHTTVVVTPS